MANFFKNLFKALAYVFFSASFSRGQKTVFFLVLLFIWAGYINVTMAQNQYRSDLSWNSTELMDDIAGVFNNLCLNINWRETQQIIQSNPDLYRIEQTDKDDEVYAKLRHPSVTENNKEVSIRLRNEYCQVAFFPHTISLYEKFKEAIRRNETVGLKYDHLTDYMSENSDGDEEFQTYYKSDAWDYPSSSGLRVKVQSSVAEINGKIDKWVNARIYKYDRSEATQAIDLKESPWEIGRRSEQRHFLDEEGISYFGAKVNTGEGVLTIWYLNNEDEYALWEFIPDFYAQSSGDDHFFKIQSDIFLDDSPDSFSAYKKCKRGIKECKKAGNFFVMPLDRQAIYELKAAKNLNFQAVTVAGERYHFGISLDNFYSVFEKAKTYHKEGDPMDEVWEDIEEDIDGE